MPTDLAGPGGRAERPRPDRLRGRLMGAGVAAALVLLFIVVAGLVVRSKESAETTSWTRAQEVPSVSVIRPEAGQEAQEVSFPGSLQAFYNAQIYARVPGYVSAWYTDIGAKVSKGQVLAKIDTPELDQQLIQARADLNSAEATMELAKTTADRWSSLLTKDAVSKQESEEKSGDYKVKSALVNAANANVGRLLALKSFARITAPFDGYVTARKTDIGALVNAGAGSSPESELFDVGEVDKLRLYVRVPQSYAARIAPGVTVSISVPEHPGQTFPATLLSTANAVSDNTGTLLVELLVANQNGALKAGDYADVRFKLLNAGPGEPKTLRLPASALLFLKTGLEAAVVDQSGRVRLRRVTVGRDLGTVMEITSGISPGDRVINNPPDSIENGEQVQVVTPAGGASADGEPR